MKTTVDIPEPIYKRAKIRAVENGQTLRQVVLEALAVALEVPAAEEELSFMAKRRLLPNYEAALKAGAFATGPDSSEILSEDRSSREDALL